MRVSFTPSVRELGAKKGDLGRSQESELEREERVQEREESVLHAESGPAGHEGLEG